MRHLGKLTSAVALTLAGPLLVAAPAADAADTSDRTIKVIQHNTDGVRGGARPAIGAANAVGADAITFQELCHSQVATLKGAGFRVLWREQRAATDRTCRKGNAIATKHAFGSTDTDLLAVHGDRRFKLVCANLRGTGVARTTVCTSHFPLDYDGKGVGLTGTQNREAVADKIKAIVGGLIANNRRVVLTGDFNDDPAATPLSRFYRVRGDGRFWEGDQTYRCGDSAACRNMEPTTSPTEKNPKGRKLDYFFASSPGVSRLTGVTKRLLKSRDPVGHYIVYGTVRFGSLG